MKPETRTLKNLNRVLTQLPQLAKVYPEIKEDFYMAYYGIYSDKTLSEINGGVCGTTGCLAGNCARLFKPRSEYFHCRRFCYSLFLRKEFPSLYDESNQSNELWTFLFDTRWEHYQPTFDQAMKRIQYVIDKKLDISGWYFQEEDFVTNEEIDN